MLTALLTVLLFCVLILPHEFGHFITAKLVGVQVNEFSMGMGPLLWHSQKGETQYSLRAIPLGGYCAMEGENEESENPRAFNNKGSGQKLLVLFAGAAMNILVAIILMIIAISIAGVTTTTIDTIQEGSPAYEAGIETGDKIISIDGAKIDAWADVSTAVTSDKPLDIVVERDDNEKEFTLTPKLEDDRFIIGVTAYKTHAPLTCIATGISSTWKMNIIILKSFKMLITGGASTDDLSGPVGIVKLVNDTSDYGALYYLYLTAMISLNLAIINLFPFPALDGGRIIFVIIRKMTGSMITDEIEGKVHTIGMLLLFSLFIFITWNDISKLFS